MKRVVRIAENLRVGPEKVFFVVCVFRRKLVVLQHTFFCSLGFSRRKIYRSVGRWWRVNVKTFHS